MKPIVVGRDDNYFKEVTISKTSFSEDSDVTIPIFGQFSFSMNNENTSAADIVEYSFNGNTLHGTMKPTKASAGVVFDNRKINGGIWFRTRNGATCIIRVEVWTAAY